MPQFSILVSVYNSEKYLCECLDSVLNQSFTDFEVVVIDDGSTDTSADICDTYAKKDNRFRVFHTENNGVFKARRAAEKHSTGEYLLHIDSDDLLDKELLSTVYESLKARPADIVFFDFYLFYPDSRKVTKTYFDTNRYFDENNKHELIELLLTTTFNSLCHKCFGRKLIASAPDYDSFERLSHGEDLLRSAHLILSADTYFYVKKPLYLYRCEIGASARFNDRIIHDSDTVISCLKELIEQSGYKTEKTDSLLFEMSRKQFNNFYRLMSVSSLSVNECRKILSETLPLKIFSLASKAKNDNNLSNIRFSLIEHKLIRTALIMQKILRKD